MKLALLLVAWVALIGPFDCSEEDDRARDFAKLAEMERQIDAMIEDRSCAEDGQCRLMPFGAKPCGGPWTYKVYSAATVDPVTLSARVEVYNAYNRELNVKYGLISDCSFALMPDVGCIDGRCQARAPGQGSATGGL
jgi:hypothetical protein